MSVQLPDLPPDLAPLSDQAQFEGGELVFPFARAVGPNHESSTAPAAR